MKKILLVLFLVLAGCSSAPQNKTDNQTAAAEEKTETTEAKSDFGFTLNEFIDEYNKNIDSIDMDVIEEPLSKLDKDGELNETKENFVQILANEKDNSNTDRDYTISGMFNKQDVLTGINLISNSDDYSKPSMKGMGAAYILFVTMGFSQDDLNKALKEADPDYSLSNDICDLTLKLRPNFKMFIIEIRPPK
ncbi:MULTISPECIES: hypothetical protein [Bacillus subtilis group]|jgi:hypothetical protein|uniref:Lipoprotein n=1 Tax=Bacillus paralicheniformis TaxID=1648923 RepID=A0AAW6KEG7_9BACI|nr:MULTISPECIES: hypothetical protein [Bacillus subtilis group]MDE1385446.1 hypothetical protein [Bacillus paralicheniformis]MDE1453602.1 hypothetical protein [Bacillus paralicheniformis]MEC1041540.1 hypothetical protein [Bacillus licheniformis]